jgi:transcriptional regulator with XRE-family HTH domain
MRTRLIAARVAKGMSQEALAEAIGRTRSAVAKYETGHSDIPGIILQKLSLVLGIALEDILYEDMVEAKSHA